MVHGGVLCSVSAFLFVINLYCIFGLRYSLFLNKTLKNHQSFEKWLEIVIKIANFIQMICNLKLQSRL